LDINVVVIGAREVLFISAVLFFVGITIAGVVMMMKESSATVKDREKARGPRHPRTARRTK